MQQSQKSAPIWAQIDDGTDYAMGGTIDVFRRGNFDGIEDDIIDLSHQNQRFSVAALSGDDQIKGTVGRDLIWGGTGDDRINGNGGDDFIAGGDGNDKILVGSGASVVEGGSGDDVIFGGELGGSIDGGAGADQIVQGEAYTSILGGDGNDTIFLKPGGQVSAGSGDDIVVVDGSAQYFSQSNLTLGSGADTIYVKNDGIYRASDAESTYLILSDADVDDAMVWNGFLLTGGALTVLVENTNGEVKNGGVAWLDPFCGAAYFFSEGSHELYIVLPDSQKMEISNFENGDFGIYLTGRFREWTYDDPWTELPRANTANMHNPFFFGAGGFASDDRILEALDVRMVGFASFGDLPTPEAPVPTAFGFL